MSLQQNKKRPRPIATGASKIIQALPIAAAITDLRGRIQCVNEVLTSLTGYASDEMVGQLLGSFSSGADCNISRIVREVAACGRPWAGEGFWRRKTGTRFTAGQTVTRIVNFKGKSGRLLVTVQDVTARKERDEEIRVAGERLSTVERMAGAGAWEWNYATGDIEGSAEWLRLHGLDAQAAGTNWTAFAAVVHPEDRSRLTSFVEAFENGEADPTAEYRVLLPNGETRSMSASGRAVYDDAGDPVKITGACIDVTERHAVDLLAAEANRDFERFFNLIPDLACIVSTDGYFKKVNHAWEALGYTREEVLRTPMLDFIHPDDLQPTLNEIARQSRVYRTKHFVNRYRCKDGSYRLFDWTTTFSRDESTRFGVARDITEQRLWEESLRESEERFRIMADSCPTIIWVTDAEGKIQMTNRTCREFFGTTFEGAEEVRQGLLLIHPEDLPAYVEKFRIAVRDRTPFRTEARVQRSDGEWRWIVSYGEPRRSLSGDFLGHVGISTDITDRKESEAALQKAKEAAEMANRSKSEFLANMSHEIRTPMNGIIGLTDLALDTELTSEQRAYLDGVKTSAESLLRILNDILDFSKIEAGKLEFEAIEFDIREAVDGVMKVLGIRAAAKELELACDFDGKVPSKALGDPGRLQQVLVNLIGNAIKFTERGEVVVSVDRWGERADGVELHFSVRDTGIGIPLDKRQHVFNAFAQADASSTRRFGGTGLGLSISSQLIRMMGGRIWVESEEGKGSTFHFTTPFHTAAAQPQTAQEDMAPFGGRAVLIADDNDSTRQILDKMLSSRGMATTLANSGFAALEALDRAAEAGDPFRLIIVDAQMPGMNGFALARQIKADPRLSAADIVLLTSGIQRGDADRCRELGVAAHLAKPVAEIEILNALRNTLHPAPAGVSQQASPRLAAETGPGLSVLVVEDNPVNRLVATRLLKKRNHMVKTASDGREALELIEKEQFDCVLMDVQMPILDGFETTAAIREKERDSDRHLPIIAMTAHAMTGDVERCLLAGMDGYLSKPINAEEVFATIARVRRSARAQAGPPAPAQAAHGHAAI